uniref:Uncharacterized protein n=1 Tax=viral metagenome TaxID=1070528 RepID=A0A6M3K316_9ZZZZ
MNGRMSKKLMREARKLARVNWIEYYNAIRKWPLSNRLRFSHDILSKRWATPILIAMLVVLAIVFTLFGFWLGGK